MVVASFVGIKNKKKKNVTKVTMKKYKKQKVSKKRKWKLGQMKIHSKQIDHHILKKKQQQMSG